VINICGYNVLMQYEPGAVILDRPTRSAATIRHVERVPDCRDLFGQSLPEHRRYVVAFDDGRYAVRVGEGDFSDPGAEFAA
jgi:hypothetical protein